MDQKNSRRQLEITVYPRKDSSNRLTRSKTVDYEQEYSSVPIRYLNPRVVVALLNQDHLEFEDHTKPPDKQPAKENELQATPKSHEQEQSEPMRDEKKSEEKQINCLKLKKLQLKKNNSFNPNLEQVIIANKTKIKEFKLEDNQNTTNNQLEIKENNNNTSNNGRIADEQGSLYLQQEYTLRSVATFEQKIKSNIIDFSRNRYYRFLLFKILESGLIQHKEWVVFTFLKEWQTVCCDQYGSKLFVECIKISKMNWHRTEYYNDFVDLILRNQPEVNEIYKNRYGIKIIRDCLYIFENEDLSNLLTKINIMLFNPFETENIGNFKDEGQVFLASEQFGCLIINTIVDNYAGEEFRDFNIRGQVEKMLKRIVGRAPQLAKNYYSNYMISNMLEKLPGTDIDNLLRESLLPVITQLSIDKFSSNVVEVAIKRGDERFLERIWRILSALNEHSEPETFEILVNDQFANYVVQSFYETVQSLEIRSEFEQLLSQLHSSSKLLSNSGQHVKGQIIDKKRKYLYPKKQQQQQSHSFSSQSHGFHRQQSDYQSEELPRFSKPPGFSSEESSSCSSSMIDSNPDFSRQTSSNMFSSQLSQTEIPNTTISSNTSFTNNQQHYLLKQQQKLPVNYQTQQKVSENINQKDNNFPRKQYYQQQQQHQQYQQRHDNHRQYQHYQQHRYQDYQNNNMMRFQDQQDIKQQKHLESSLNSNFQQQNQGQQQQQQSQPQSPFVSPLQQQQSSYIMMAPFINKPIEQYSVNYINNNNNNLIPQMEWKPSPENVSGLVAPQEFQQTSNNKMQNEWHENNQQQQHQQQQSFRRTPNDQWKRGNQYPKYSANENNNNNNNMQMNQKISGNHQYQQQQILLQPLNQLQSVQTLDNQHQVVS